MLARRWAVLLLTLTSGCAAGPDRPAVSAARPAPDRAVAVVFCADGAGGLGETTDTLAHVIAEEGVPLRVERVEWSHGAGRFLLDHLDLFDAQRGPVRGEHLREGVRAFTQAASPVGAEDHRHRTVRRRPSGADRRPVRPGGTARREREQEESPAAR